MVCCSEITRKLDSSIAMMMSGVELIVEFSITRLGVGFA